MLLDERNRPGVHAAQFDIALQEQEDFQQRRRVAHEDLLVQGFQIPVARLESRPHRLHRRL